MKARRLFARLQFVLGLLVLAVGVVHFVMMPSLVRWIERLAGPVAAPSVVPIFYINHVGSGVFLIVLGGIAVCISRMGLSKGKRWARPMTLLFGIGLGLVGVALWATLPAMFLEAPPFRFALLSLMAIGLLTVIPVLVFWRHFDEE